MINTLNQDETDIKMIYECCICRDWKDPVTHKYYTPKPEERRALYFKEKKKISHGYCPVCCIMQMEADGLKPSEIEEIVKETEKIK